MNFDTLTEEQREALKMTDDRTTAVYDHCQTVIDVATGEIVSANHTTVKKTSGEPDFIKLYYRTMMAFKGVDDIPLSFVLALSEHITWSNDGEPSYFFNSRLTREAIERACSFKKAMYDRYIKRCKASGLLLQTAYRGTYEVNPFFIAKGKWDSIKQLRASFDFIDGKWERQEVSDDQPS